MRISEYIEKKRNEHIVKKKTYEDLVKYLIDCKSPEKVVKEIDFNNCMLPATVLGRKVDGYYNLYDFILKEVCTYARGINEDLSKPEIVIPWIINNKNLHGICNDNETLLMKLPDGSTVLEYLCKNDEFFQYFHAIDNIEVARILYKNGHENCLRLCHPSLYKEEIEDGLKVSEAIINNKIIPKDFRIAQDTFSFDIADSSDILLEKVDDKKTLLEFMLDNNMNFKLDLYNSDEKTKKIIMILFKNRRLDIVNNTVQEVLKMPLKNDLTIASLFSSDKTFPNIIGYIDDEDIVEKYYFGGQSKQLLKIITKEALCRKIENGNFSILDFLIIDAQKQGKEELRDLLMTLHHRKLIGKEAAITLASYGYFFEPNDYDMETGINKNNELIDYLYDDNYSNSDNKYEELIKEFYEAFNDGLSNKLILDLVIKSFNKYCLTDEEKAVIDLKSIIDFKRNNKDFKFEYNPNKGSYFSSNCLSIENINNIDYLNHELGHLLYEHHFGKYNTSKEIESLVEPRRHMEMPIDDRMKIFKEINDEASELLIPEEEYNNIFLDYIFKKYGSLEEYKSFIKKDFEELFGTDKFLLECLKSGNYSESVMNAITDSYFGYQDEVDKDKLLDSYVTERMDLEFKLFKKELYQKNNCDFLCYENFIDAYFYGAIGDTFSFYHNMLSFYNIDVKAPVCTHNSVYFCRVSPVDELFANYIQLLKSDNASLYINKLREKTDPKLIDELEQLYRSMGIEESKKL